MVMICLLHWSNYVKCDCLVVVMGVGGQGS